MNIFSKFLCEGMRSFCACVRSFCACVRSWNLCKVSQSCVSIIMQLGLVLHVTFIYEIFGDVLALWGRVYCNRNCEW